MPKNKKGKARAHFEEAPIPLAPPPPPGGRSPAPFQDGLDDDEFALPGSLLDGGGVHEDARNSPRATGWGNQPNSWAQGDDNGGDGWANGDEGDGGTEGDDGWGAKNGSNGGWGNNSDKGGDGWGNGKGRGGSGWDNESREQSGDGWADEWDGGSQRDQSWAQPAQRADPRHGLWQNRIASQTTTPRLKDMNFAPSGRSTRHPPGPTAAWQSWGQQAVPSAPPPPQPAPRSRAPAAQTRAPGWSNWAAEARGASQAGIVPSNAGGGWGNVQANPPPAVPAGGGWGSLPAQNSHVSLAPSHNAQHNAQYGRRADVGNQQRQILQGLLGRSFQQGFPPQQLNSPGRFHQAPPPPPPPPPQKHREQERRSQRQWGERGHQHFQGWDDITEETEEEEEEEEGEDEWEDLGEEDLWRTPKSPKSPKSPGRPSPPVEHPGSSGPGRLTSVLSSVLGPQKLGISYPMPSRTMAIAAQGGHPVANGNFTRDRRSSQQPVQIAESKGAAVAIAQRAMYSRDRKAKDRIFWVFSPHKDERVASALGYIEAMSADIATFGLQKFFETRERGALFTNAGFRTGDSPPVFDWMTFDQLQATRDQTIETSVAYYDPAVHVIVFVFLLSRSGNSMAIWRRKLNVPNNLRLRYIHEIQLAKSALRNDYEIHVDELPYDEEPMEMPPEEPPPPPPKKKRGFWRRLKFW